MIKELLKQAYIDVKLNRGLRVGQAMFNHLYDVDPEFADSLRGSDIDPFYADDYEDERVQGFLRAIAENKGGILRITTLDKEGDK